MLSSLSISEKLDNLRADYIQQLPNILNEIRRVWVEYKSAPNNLANVRNLFRLTHNLSGSGGGFGFNEISSHAKILSEKLHTQMDVLNKNQENTHNLLELGELLQNLRLACKEHKYIDKKVTPVTIKPQLHQENAPRPSNHIFLVEDDPFQAGQISLQLEKFAYKVSVFNDLSSFIEEISTNHQKPVAILIDVDLPEGNAGEILSHLCL